MSALSVTVCNSYNYTTTVSKMQQQNEVKPISVKFSSRVIYVDTSEVSFSSKMSREPSAGEGFWVGGSRSRIYSGSARGTRVLL